MSLPNKSRFGFSWNTGAQATPTYTPAEKKGEINELKSMLRDPLVERDHLRRRDVLKRVIAFMTMGVDTSPLFTEMILACVTKDLVQKKMVYLYLCVHSETNSEIAILAINTLQKDCKDESPLVRGLALRSLASLRLPNLAEYLVPTLKLLLVDTAPYVRKTAILATLKLFRFAPETFRQMGLTDKMYGMLRDNDAVVATNALAVLQEVLADDGGVQVSKQILYFLLNRLRDYPEWQQVHVLQLCLKYTPKDEEEMFDIMNLLEERLRGSNSAVIVACSHVFLHLTQNLPAVHKQVFDRLREPLLTLMATSHSTETAYAILCHIKLLVQRNPRAFANAYKDFYCRHTDPSYIRSIKMDILGCITTATNSSDVVDELMAYVSDVNTDVSRLAITTMGAIALRIEGAAKATLKHFLDLLEMDVQHIRGQTLVVMKDFLRKYVDIEFVRPFLDTIVKSYQEMAFEDDESKVAFAWVLGEFGEHIEDAPYLLLAMVQSFNTESYQLRIELLTACMKLFFKRPPEMQPVLAAMFSQAINDFSHADVHDRALLYYRLLRHNPMAAAQVVTAPKEVVTQFIEDDDRDECDKLFEEFNTLSVVYRKPASQFIRLHDAAHGDDDDDAEEEDGDESEEGDEESESEGGGTHLLSQTLELSDDAAVEPPEFQGKWGKLPVAASLQLRFKSVPQTSELEERLEDFDVFTMASGQQGTTTKMYLFAQPVDNEDAHFLVELQMQATGNVSLTIKSDDTRAESFVSTLKKGLAKFLAA